MAGSMKWGVVQAGTTAEELVVVGTGELVATVGRAGTAVVAQVEGRSTEVVAEGLDAAGG